MQFHMRYILPLLQVYNIYEKYFSIYRKENFQYSKNVFKGKIFFNSCSIIKRFYTNKINGLMGENEQVKFLSRYLATIHL